MFRIAALALLALAPVAALACEPDYPGREKTDRPITLWSDGSFQDASDDDGWYDLSGRPIRDIGGGRTGQVIEQWSCVTSESLLVVDCTTGSAILVSGAGDTPLPPELQEPNVSTSARALQPPYGPLALTPSITIAEIQQLAQARGWRMETDVPAWAAERGRQNTFNPFMGCEIFYPGSVGASR
jgi:hypothetical protein